MAENLILDILVSEPHAAAVMEQRLLEILQREYPGTYVESTIKSADHHKTPSRPKASPWQVNVVVDNPAQRLIVKYTRNRATPRAFVAANANVVPLSYRDPTPLPFILFQLEDGRHFWAYSVKKQAPIDPGELNQLMDQIAEAVSDTLEQRVTVACSGWLLSDSLGAFRSPYANMNNPPAYHNEEVVDFIVRRWDGQIQQVSAMKVMSYSRLRSNE